MNAKHVAYLLMAFALFVFLYPPAQLYFLSDDWDSLLFSLQPARILHSYRPLSDAVLYLDYSMWKLNATGFHITNFVLHFSSVLCVYSLAKDIFHLRYDDTLSGRLALLSGILFLFYPFHSEAIFWIVGRGAMLCTLFSLLSILFFIRKDTTVWMYPLSLFCFLLALLSYEEAWILPLIIVVLIWAKPNKNKRTSYYYAAGFLFVFVLYFGARYFFTNDLIGTPYGSARMIDFDLFRWCKNAGALIARSVVAPMQSSLIFVLAVAFVFAAIVSLLFLFRKKLNAVIVVSGICFSVSLLPVIPLGIDTHDTESERFLYFPSLFLAIFFTQLIAFVFERKLWLAYLLVIMEIIILRLSYGNFSRSSKVSEATISALYQTGSADTIFCTHLPDEYKGAFIFRNGFEGAVKLIKKDSVHSVVILSRDELFHPSKNYNTEFIQPSINRKHNLQIEWKEDKVILKR